MDFLKEDQHDEEEEEEEDEDNILKKDNVDSEEKEKQEMLKQAELSLRKYWDQSFEHDDTIEKIRKGEEEVLKKRGDLLWFAELVGIGKERERESERDI